MTQTAVGADARQIIIQPNCSLSDAEARYFVIFVATASLMVAGSFAVMGFWPILPFAGLEICLLVLALRLVRKDTQPESIRVTERRVLVSGGRSAANESYDRHWAGIRFQSPPDRSGHRRVTIDAHGRQREIGAALNECARMVLWKKMYTLIGPVAASPDLETAPLNAGETARISNIADEEFYEAHRS